MTTTATKETRTMADDALNAAVAKMRHGREWPFAIGDQVHARGYRLHPHLHRRSPGRSTDRAPGQERRPVAIAAGRKRADLRRRRVRPVLRPDLPLSYLVWRDTKTALLLFIRSGETTTIIEKAAAEIRNHP